MREFGAPGKGKAARGVEVWGVNEGEGVYGRGIKASPSVHKPQIDFRVFSSHTTLIYNLSFECITDNMHYKSQ